MISFIVYLLVVRVIGLLINSKKATEVEPVNLELKEIGGELPREVLDRIDRIFEHIPA